jgi:hypothetical protein
MDPREYARRAYVHHRAKASAYSTAGEHTRAVGHARRAERHRAAAFGLPVPAQIILAVGAAVAGAGAAVGLGYLGRRAYAERARARARKEQSDYHARLAMQSEIRGRDERKQ